MIAGHFGFAALVKSREKPVPLWSLMLATVWLDIVFIPLVVAGIETFEPVPGTDGGYGAHIIHADYTHSLIGALILSALFGLVAAWPWGRRSGWVLGFVVFSHWLLDLIMHRGDMPVLPANIGDLPRLGFGLWRYPTASIAVEALIVIAGAFFYWRAAQSVTIAAGRGGRLAALTGLLILLGGLGILALDAISV
jgi:membrane-bound metal-dependent hydrolase YbcI (DUF457 family)